MGMKMQRFCLCKSIQDFREKTWLKEINIYNKLANENPF